MPKRRLKKDIEAENDELRRENDALIEFVKSAALGKHNHNIVAAAQEKLRGLGFVAIHTDPDCPPDLMYWAKAPKGMVYAYGNATDFLRVGRGKL